MSKDEQFGRFRLFKRLAVGGMGEVHLARYLNASGIERLAVVKRILPHLSSDQDFIEYFLGEGRITSLLSHPNVVQTLELGQTDGIYYIAMEFIPGTTMVRYLAHSMKIKTPFSISLVLHLARQMASALEYIHNLKSLEDLPLKIIHMDIAPHNILISPDAQMKLVDFGISRATGLGHDSRRRSFRGRTAYLAPEQLDGLDLDNRADLFAMGIIMHEMVMGRPLFRARTDPQTATRILYSPIPSLQDRRSDCPEMLAQIIYRALLRDRDERYQDAREILADLDLCAQQHNIVGAVTPIREELAQYRESMDLEHSLAALPTVPTDSSKQLKSNK